MFASALSLLPGTNGLASAERGPEVHPRTKVSGTLPAPLPRGPPRRSGAHHTATAVSAPQAASGFTAARPSCAGCAHAPEGCEARATGVHGGGTTRTTPSEFTWRGTCGPSRFARAQTKYDCRSSDGFEPIPLRGCCCCCCRCCCCKPSLRTSLTPCKPACSAPSPNTYSTAVL